MQTEVASASSNNHPPLAILDLASQNGSSHLYPLTAHLLFPWHFILMDIKSYQFLASLTGFLLLLELRKFT